MVEKVKPPRKAATKEHEVLVGVMLSRFKSIPFKNKKQMDAFKNHLLDGINAVIQVQNEKWVAAKQVAKEAKAARLETQMAICARWCQIQLAVGSLVMVRNDKGTYRVVAFAEGAAILEHVFKTSLGTWLPSQTLAQTTQPFGNIDQVYLDDALWNIYTLASGGKGTK